MTDAKACRQERSWVYFGQAAELNVIGRTYAKLAKHDKEDEECCLLITNRLFDQH